MALHVVHECSQCGAPIEVDESHRLIACGHCGVRGVLIGERPRYLLSPRAGLDATLGDEILWAPYLRVRGGLFVVGDGGVGTRVLDATRRGLPSNALPETLGFRVQTQILRVLTARAQGRFLAFSLPAERVLGDMMAAALADPPPPRGQEAPAARGADLASDDDREAGVTALLAGIGDGTWLEALDSAGAGSRAAAPPAPPRATLPPICVGEVASVIFAPLRVHGRRVHDAITGDLLGGLPAGLDLGALTDKGPPPSRARVVAALCPECGGDLAGEAASVALLCANCGAAWESDGEALERRSVRTESARGAELHLPFWRFVPRPGAGVPATVDALARATNQRLLHVRDRAAVPAFYCPAFAVRPQVMLRLAGRLTLAQWSSSSKESAPARGVHPVTLGSREAAKTLLATFADLALPKQGLAARLRDVAFDVAETELFYLGFRAAGQQWVDGQGRLAVDRAALAFAARA